MLRVRGLRYAIEGGTRLGLRLSPGGHPDRTDKPWALVCGYDLLAGVWVHLQVGPSISVCT